MTTVAELSMIPARTLARLGLHRAGVTTANVRDELAAIRVEDPELADSIADRLAVTALALIRGGHERPAQLAADTLAVIDPEGWAS